MRDVEYNATVRFDGELPEPVIDRLLDALEPFGAVVGAQPGGLGTEVVLTVDAVSLRAATDVALEKSEAVVGARAAAVEVLPTSEFDAR